MGETLKNLILNQVLYALLHFASVCNAILCGCDDPQSLPVVPSSMMFACALEAMSRDEDNMQTLFAIFAEHHCNV